MLNVKLLRKVKKHILSNPARLRMSQWIIEDDPGTVRQIDSGWEHPRFTIPDCGTVGCIAGWACILSGKAKTRNPESCATKLLRISDHDADRLFLVPFWPEPLQSRYFAAKRQSTRAKIVAERIDYIIAGKG
jgi:hypothetical protein